MPKHSTRTKGAIKHERSSGNVFADVGLPDEYVAKADLVARIDEIIARRRLTQLQAAELVGIDQPRVSALLRGKLDLFSLSKLMDIARRLGNRVEIVVRPSAAPAIVVALAPTKHLHGAAWENTRFPISISTGSTPPVRFNSLQVGTGELVIDNSALHWGTILTTETRPEFYREA
jgi:predicted XRE-type DNA-binding protein